MRGATIDPERWQRIRTILEQAFEQPVEARAALLTRACQGDEALRAEIEGYIAADSEADTLEEHLARLPAAVADAMDNATTDDDALIGLTIDRYRILQRLGKGGTATVYLAERNDAHYKKRVALKLIRAGDTEHLLTRFRNERQILAGLEHPNIARLFDGGLVQQDGVPTALAGRPYMVMEHVDGLPIDQHCDRHRLSIEERLALVCTACKAVQYAHQNLVIHRDLKPGNILVSHEGSVKLLDFGIAKVINPELSSSTLAVTHSDLRVLSPSYASPEQLLGEKVTTASDVYALGVVLFELLTGRRPYRTGTGLEALIGQILDGSTPRPSASFTAISDRPVELEQAAGARGATVVRLRHQLLGDLDAIVVRCLAREPRDRYATAEQLHDDLHRYLTGQPTLARGGHAWYRVRKLVSRHRAATATVLLTLVAFGATLTTAITQARRAAAAQVRAEEEATIATEVSEFLISLFERASPDTARGERVSVRAVLDEAASQISTDLDQSAEVKTALLEAMGRAYMSLGAPDRAGPLFEEALALLVSLRPANHRDIAISQRQLGGSLLSQGFPTRAAAVLRDSLNSLLQQADGEGFETARGRSVLSYATGMLGEDQETEALRRRALAGYREHAPDDDLIVAQALNDLGQILTMTGAFAEAEAFHRQALERRRSVLGERNPAVASSLRHLSATLLEADRLDEAERLAREAVRVSRAIFEPIHPRMALALDQLAHVLIARQRFDEVESLVDEALLVWNRAHPAGQSRTVLMLANRVEVALHRGDHDDAERQLARAESLMLRVTPPNHLARVVMLGLRGRTLAAAGQHEEATRILNETLTRLGDRGIHDSLATRQARTTLRALSASPPPSIPP